MRYRVSGTIELNWEVDVDADSEEEAERKAIMMAEDGHGMGLPVQLPEVNEVTLIEDEED